MNDNQTLPLVAVVVTTKNEEKNIANCLESIKGQTWRNIEVIVVDNNSTDNTQAIAKNYTDKVYTKGPERSAQRNYGIIEKARGDYVLFLDADMIITPYLVENCVKFIEKENCVALYLKEIVLGKKYFSRVRRFEREFYDGTVVDGARFFKREAFISVRGFDETLNGPEDWDLDKKFKQKGKIILLPPYTNLLKAKCELPKESQSGLIENNQINFPQIFINLKNLIEKYGVKCEKNFNGLYHNEAEFQLLKYLKKKSYYTKDFEVYINKWGKSDHEIKKQFSFLYRYFWVFIENGKWEKLIKRPDLALGMYFLRIFVGIIFAIRKLGIKLKNVYD